ncbi:MAG: hypothetical protein ABFR47_04050, partial [Verrucomicrobiota bacterium]
MNLSDLSKEKKQRLALVGIGFAVFASLLVFGFKVGSAAFSSVKSELQELTGKIESAGNFVTKSRRDNAEFSLSIAKLKSYLAQIPPDQNHYSWATETIYAEARSIGFEIDVVDEVNRSVSAVSSKGQKGVASYALRITAHGGYEDVKRFLHRISSNHPLVRVTGIEISSGTSPEVHDVQLFIQWPHDLGYIAKQWENVPVQLLVAGQSSAPKPRVVAQRKPSEEQPVPTKKEQQPAQPKKPVPVVRSNKVKASKPRLAQEKPGLGSSTSKKESVPVLRSKSQVVPEKPEIGSLASKKESAVPVIRSEEGEFKSQVVQEKPPQIEPSLKKDPVPAVSHAKPLPSPVAESPKSLD